MTNLAIRAENVSKKYRIGAKQSDYRTFREAIMEKVTSSVKRIGRRRARSSSSNEQIWALKNVSFDVDVGEVIGIIGSNGAGKSTLLKILSRITKPTTGYVDIYGRVGSLLEVGTGFHQELTGRENVFLNGTVIGMNQSEIESRFDEIVDFSGVEKFIDTPVKFYSSGMHVRLGFAVAAHLEAEIMLVDEVLAVGDVQFRQKSLNKLSELANGGRTIVFVSHNLPAIKKLCSRALWLVDGQIQSDGKASKVVDSFMLEMQPMSADTKIYEVTTIIEYPLDKDKSMQVLSARLDSPVDGIIPITESLTFRIEIDTRTTIENAYICINIRNKHGRILYWTSDIGSDRYVNPSEGRDLLLCECPPRLLTPGKYMADFSIMRLVDKKPQTIFSSPNDQIVFQIADRESLLASYRIPYPGISAVPSHWSIQKVEALSTIG